MIGTRVAAAFCSLILLQLPSTLHVDVQLQQIIATVRDGEGHLVKNLNPDQFVLEEDGVPQRIVHFSQDSETPVSLGILIDQSGSMGVETGGLTAMRAASGATRVLLRLMKPR